MAVRLVGEGSFGDQGRRNIFAHKVDGALMEYAAYVAAIAALGAGIFLYVRRKVRKPINRTYHYQITPPGGDPLHDRIEFHTSKPWPRRPPTA